LLRIVTKLQQVVQFCDYLFCDYLQQVVPALAGGRYLLGLMPPRLLFLPLYPGASWMLPVHFALQLLCITFDAPTNSQSGAADMRRPPVNHIEPPLGKPSGPFIDPPYAPRPEDPHDLSALPLLCCH
jgi:hypothetical protein